MCFAGKLKQGLCAKQGYYGLKEQGWSHRVHSEPVDWRRGAVAADDNHLLLQVTRNGDMLQPRLLARPYPGLITLVLMQQEESNGPQPYEDCTGQDKVPTSTRQQNCIQFFEYLSFTPPSEERLGGVRINL
jgi:hypothetical protein